MKLISLFENHKNISLSIIDHSDIVEKNLRIIKNTRDFTEYGYDAKLHGSFINNSIEFRVVLNVTLHIDAGDENEFPNDTREEEMFSDKEKSYKVQEIDIRDVKFFSDDSEEVKVITVDNQIMDIIDNFKPVVRHYAEENILPPILDIIDKL